MALLTSGFAQKVLGVQVKKMFQPLGFFSGLSLIGRREIMVAQSIFWTSTLNPALRRFAAFTLSEGRDQRLVGGIYHDDAFALIAGFLQQRPGASRACRRFGEVAKSCGHAERGATDQHLPAGLTERGLSVDRCERFLLVHRYRSACRTFGLSNGGTREFGLKLLRCRGG